MHCPKCGSKEKVKAGFIKKSQRYQCKSCMCKYARSTPHGFPLRIIHTADSCSSLYTWAFIECDSPHDRRFYTCCIKSGSLQKIIVKCHSLGSLLL